MARSLWALSACEAAHALRLGDVRVRELLASHRQRIEQTQPYINALSHVADEVSLDEAVSQSEQRLADGQARSWLEGLPVSVKDNLWVQGMPATWGSAVFRDFVPPEDDLPVAQLRHAGALIIGKSNTPELALAGVTENSLYGATRNPWAQDCTPGGSSGGAAASVACGQTALALATDAGGSIRRPAAYTGVVGLRPTTGLLARPQGFPATTIDLQVVGPMARNVTDCAMLVQSLAPHALPAGLLRADARGIHLQMAQHGGSRVRVFIDETIPHEPAVLKAMQEASACLRDGCLKVERGGLPFGIDEVDLCWAGLIGIGTARALKSYEACEDKLTPLIRALLARGKTATAEGVLDTAEGLMRIRHAASRLWEECDFLLTPASPCTAWALGKGAPEEIAGRAVGPRAAARYAAFVNIIGAPAIVLPWTMDAQGRPIGIQIVAAPWRDAALMQLACQLESGRPDFPDVCAA